MNEYYTNYDIFKKFLGKDLWISATLAYAEFTIDSRESYWVYARILDLTEDTVCVNLVNANTLHAQLDITESDLEAFDLALADPNIEDFYKEISLDYIEIPYPISVLTSTEVFDMLNECPIQDEED